jgi:hypothetical protein
MTNTSKLSPHPDLQFGDRARIDAMVQAQLVLEGRCPSWLRDAEFSSLPQKCKDTYYAVITIPANTIYSEIDPNIPVSELVFQTIPEVHPRLSIGFSTEAPNDIVNCLFMPDLSMIRPELLDLKKQYMKGNISVYLNNNPALKYPLWTITYWVLFSEIAKSKEIWNKAERFIQEGILESVDQERSRLLSEMLEFMRGSGWDTPLFNKVRHFNHSTLLMADFLEHDWASLGQIHCALLALRVRYSHLQKDHAIVTSSFEQAVFESFKGTATHVDQEVIDAAAWLREDPSRKIVASVWHKSHWASMLIQGNGRITISDSNHTETFPPWWNARGSAWESFFRLVDIHITIDPILVDFGAQLDSYSCGPASICAIRKFLDPTAPKWDSRSRTFGRASVAYDTFRFGLVSS